MSPTAPPRPRRCHRRRRSWPRRESRRARPRAHGDSRARRTESRSTYDLELQPPPGVRAAGADERAQRTREPALAADHLADVTLRDVQAEHERAVVAFGLLDAHGVRLVDEPARELLEQLRQLRDALDLEQPGDGLGRLGALLEPAAHLLLVELDEGRLGLRVVAPDDLDELAVAR